ncbi:hypothetical protein [Microvirga sp. G4-2]|uniref:hypothetical protein n=1 Tax=Microvirga sp. G4-2 TaxID=3434467 RepID=UPI0040450830
MLDRAQPASDPAEQDSQKSYSEPSQWNAASVIQSLVSGPETTKLAAEVGELLRQGDWTGAHQILSAAVDTATFATIAIDSLRDPEVQKLLQSMARERRPPPSAQGVPAGNGGKADGSGDAVERERIRAEAALQELHTVQEKLTAMTQDAVRAAARRDEQARELEKRKAELSELTVKLTEAQEQLARLKGSAEEAAELRAALERERGAARFSAREIESLKRQVVKLPTIGVSPSEAASSAPQEKERADAATQQLNTMRGQLAALRESEVRMQSELEQEKGRSASAARALLDSQREVLALKAQAASAAAIQEALRQEKEMTAAALREVHALKKQIADLEPRTEFVPAALLFQIAPVLPGPSAKTSQDGAQPGSGAGSGGDISERKARQASLSPQVETERNSPDEATMQPRRRNLPLRPVEEKSVRPPSGSPKLAAASDRTTVVKLKRSRSLPTRENSAAKTLPPDLPESLLPADGLWSSY